MKRFLLILYRVFSIAYLGLLGLNIFAQPLMYVCTSIGTMRTCTSRLGSGVGNALHAFLYGYIGTYQHYSVYYVLGMVVGITVISFFVLQGRKRIWRTPDLYICIIASMAVVLALISAHSRA